MHLAKNVRRSGKKGRLHMQFTRKSSSIHEEKDDSICTSQKSTSIHEKVS